MNGGEHATSDRPKARKRYRRSHSTVKVEDGEIGRPTCYACFRPVSHCVCSLIEPFQAHCRVLILQHPHERRRYYSTAKLVTRAIRNSQLLPGIIFDPEILQQATSGGTSYVLYPGPRAVSCSEVTLKPEDTVIALDGTWNEAGKIMYRNPAIQQLACLSFNTTLVSQYRIRKQPKTGYLSTIESLAHLLQINALAAGKPDQATLYDRLFDGFNRMVEQQMETTPRFRST